MKRILFIIILGIWVSNVAGQTGQLTIVWDQNTEPDIASYRVERSVNNGSFGSLQNVAHPATQVVDNSVSPGNSYRYRVIAIDDGGLQSNFSNTAEAGIPQISLSIGSVSNGGDTTIAFSSFLSDPDGAPGDLTITISQESNISVAIESSALRLTPPSGFTGAASFTIRAADNDGFFDEQTVNFSIVEGILPTQISVSIPDVRFAEDGSFAIAMDTCVTVDNFVASQISWQFSGDAMLNLQFNAASRLLTVQSAQPNINGQANFSATATAPDNASASDNVAVTISAVNDPPVINLSQLNLTSDPNQNEIDLKQFASDVDDATVDLRWEFLNFSDFSFEWVDQTNDIVRITPPSAGGTETGTFRVRDIAGATVSAQVTLIAPGVSNSTITITIPPLTFEEDDSLILQLDDHVTVTNFTPAELLWSFSGGSNLRYTFRALDRSLKIESQSPNWFGQDAFQVSATAPDQNSAGVSVSVNIQSVNDKPVLFLDELRIPDISSNTFDLKIYADDVDDPVRSLNWSFTGYSQFTFEWENESERILRIVPQGSNIVESGIFEVTDPHGAAFQKQVTILYSEQNTPPHLIFSGPLTIAEDSVLVLDLRDHVVDSSNVFTELTWEFAASENLDIIYRRSDGTLTIQPKPDWSGEANLAVRVSDPFGETDNATVQILVSQRNGILNLTVQDSDNGDIRISFNSELPSRSELRYWRIPVRVEQLSNSDLATQHEFLMTDLLPRQQYFYEIRLRDEQNALTVLLDSLTTGNFRNEQEPKEVTELIVYPNPIKTAKGHSEMIFRNLPETVRRIELYSLVGQKVYEASLSGLESDSYRIDVLANADRLPSGIYVYQVKDENSRVLKQDRIVVIR